MQQQDTFRQLFKQEPDTFDNKVFLKDIADQYPYFGAARFFMLKNTDQYQYSEYNEAAQKAALFFNDPFFLKANLTEKQFVPEPEPVFQSPEAILPAAEENAITVNEEPLKEIPVKETIPAVSEELLFEPLHASDYFASQGIKLSDDVMEDDKLGKQLKSFTSWLKTMKKVHPNKLAETSSATETAVQSLAEKSNKEEEILTESMAEAFSAQGKQQKALEIYEKLSLLNPDKSAYFAAKIESLK